MDVVLKGSIIKGVAWSSLDRFLSQGIQFIFGVLIARLLTPDDYGVIAILNVFVAIFQTFVDSGLARALVRKESCSEEDFSTVFFYNIIVSVIAYSILWIVAPVISDFYNNESLTLLIRIISITLVVSSLSGVHDAKLSINLDFKRKALISIITVLINGTIVLLLAYSGYGVWALVIQSILNGLLRTVLLWIFVNWKPRLVFSTTSFCDLFSFGSKILGSSLVDTIYNNIYTLVIGRCFSPRMLGLYSKANTLSQFVACNITNVFTSVSYPAFSKIQHDEQLLSEANKKYIRLSSFVIFPLMIGLIILAEPLITVLLKDKWLNVVPFMQILCVEWILYPIHAINLNLLWVKGHSDYYLKLEFIRKFMSIIVLLVTVRYGVEAMCYGRVFTSIIGLIINTYYSKKLINYSLFAQIKDVIPILLHSVIMGFVVFLSTRQIEISLVKLLVGVLVGSSYYLIIAQMLSMREFLWLKTTIFQLLKR